MASASCGGKLPVSELTAAVKSPPCLKCTKRSKASPHRQPAAAAPMPALASESDCEIQNSVPSSRLYRYLGTASLPGKAFSGFELFLKTGQTVFAGIHPATGLPYEWVIKSPQDSPPSDAPETTYEKVAELIEALRPLGAVFKAAGVSNRRQANPIAPTGLGASDRRSGAVASVLPVLCVANAPLATAAEIVAAAQPGGRYPAAFGVVVALVQFGFDDNEIWNAVSLPFAAHFPDAAERRARLGTIASALRWARGQIGPDATTLAADPAIQSLQRHWEAGLP
jgi:hypothetical protein